MRRTRRAVIGVLALLSTAVTAPGLPAQAAPPAPGAQGRAVAYDRTIPLLDRKLQAPGIDQQALARARAGARGAHAVVQLHALPRPGDLAELADLGITPLAYLNGRTGVGTAYLAALSPQVADAGELEGLVRAVHALQPRDKVDPQLARGGAARAVLVTFFADVPAAQARGLLSAVGTSGRSTGAGTWLTSATTSQVARLATEDAVQFLALAPEAGQLDLDDSRDLINVDELQRFDVPSATYLGLSGNDVDVSIHDSGVDEHHGDFAGRMTRTLHPGAGGDHGTHVASIAVGSGARSNGVDDAMNPNNGTAFQWRGMAPQAGISAFGSQTAHDTGTMTDAIVTDGVDVSNHSYSYNDGQYDATMASIDSIVRGDVPGLPARPMVFSAGNQGQAKQYGENSGYYSVTKSCKNCLMVANLQDTGALSGGSSHGPTPDGRLKPEVGALGVGVIAAGADVGDGDGGSSVGNSYRSKGGTSMSTPAVTGTVALLLERYGQRFGDIDTAPPLPSTVKALLVQSAVDQAGTASGTNPDTGAATTYGTGPDWGTGYGLVDAQAALALLDTDRFLEDSVADADATDEHLVSVAPGQTELRVTLAWDDLPGTPNANHAAASLVNDLDLLLVGPQGQVVRPQVLPGGTQFDCDGDASNGTQTGCANPGADTGVAGTVSAQGTDRLNNLEQVVVAAPAAGTWKARVSVLNTDGSLRLPLGGTQSYSLAGVTTERADLSVTKTASPMPAIAGEQLDYSIRVANDGPDAALGVTAVDVLPAGVSYVATDLPGGCVEAPAGTLTCAVGDLAPGASRTFVITVEVDPGIVATTGPRPITNTVTVASTTPDDDTSDNTAVRTVVVEDRADLQLTKICKPDRQLSAGETGFCTVFVDNLGPSAARDVVLRDKNLSDGAFTVEAVSTSQGACTTPADGLITCLLGTLPAASTTETGRAVVVVEVSATEQVDINDLADVRSATPDPVTANNSAQGSINVQAVADLSVTKSGPPTAVAGTTVAYQLSVRNDGPSTAEGVVVEDVAPDGVSILSVVASDGATCQAGTPGSATLPTRCSFGTLAPGASRTMTVTVKVLPATVGVIHNDARVLSQTFDPDASDDLATVPTTVTAVADLALTKTASPDPVVAGTQLTYTLTVSNAGPSTARGVRVTDTLPAGTSFVSGVDGNGATVCALVQARTLVCDLGDLTPGDVRTVLVTVLVGAGVDPGPLVNSATVGFLNGTLTTDPDLTNNSASASATVRTEADLWLDKQATNRSGNPSPVLVYSLVVHNDAGCETDAQSTPTPTCGAGGPSDARGITVTDKLPLDPKKLVVQYVSPQCTYVKATHTVTCTSARVPAGAKVTFVIEAQVSGSVGTITNTAKVVSATTDPVLANNSNAATVVMKGGTGKR